MMRAHDLSKRAALGIALVSLIATPLLAQGLRYPETRRGDVVEDYHGTMVADPYRWLEDVDSDETKAWVQAQNEVTFSFLESIPERDVIRERLTELWNHERYEVPHHVGGRYFFKKNDGLQAQDVLYMQSSLDGEPEVLLDPNQLSEDGTVALGVWALSEDGKTLAYAVSRSGSDWREVYVRDVETGEDLADHVRWMKFSELSWTHDSRGFFYARFPEPREGEQVEGVNFHHTIYYHRVGTPQSSDLELYASPDNPKWGFDTVVTDDGRYAVIYVWQGTGEQNRIYYMDLGDPEAPRLDGDVVELIDNFDADYTLVGNDGTVFYFRTNLDAPRGRLIAIDIENPAPENWREIIPETEDVLDEVQLITDQFVTHYIHDAHSQLRVYSREGELAAEIELPVIGTVREMSGTREGSELFYDFASFTYGGTIFRYDFETAETSAWQTPELDFDASQFVTEQVFYASKDGTRVPMFITRKKGIKLDGTNPVFLFGYGGFNISMLPRYRTYHLVWLELGGIYAQANLRGGGEYGEEWHQAGTLGHKQNVFDDFIAAAEYLIAEGYTTSDKLAIGGGSNGGLLVGAVMTQRPDLFAAALPDVGVMDMLRFHKFTIGWAWVDDYGSSDDPEDFKFLYEYSPLHNLRPADYPATLVTTADHDDRVVPGHSFKFAARLQEVQTGEAPVLIRIQTKAGHGPGKPTDVLIQEYADRWGFVMDSLGLTLPHDTTHE